MGLSLVFGQGDRSEWDAKVRAALEAEYGARDFWGRVEVDLHYTAGRGYQIIRAQYFAPAVASVGEGGDLPAPEPPEDYTTQVEAILQRVAAPMT